MLFSIYRALKRYFFTRKRMTREKKNKWARNHKTTSDKTRRHFDQWRKTEASTPLSVNRVSTYPLFSL